MFYPSLPIALCAKKILEKPVEEAVPATLSVDGKYSFSSSHVSGTLVTMTFSLFDDNIYIKLGVCIKKIVYSFIGSSSSSVSSRSRSMLKYVSLIASFWVPRKNSFTC